jgi:hypothetical protein
MTTEKHKATAKEYFEANPSENVVHITTDGQVFFQKNQSDAVNHQRRINEKESLVSIYRKSLEENEAVGGEDTTPTEEQTKAEISAWLTGKAVVLTGKENKVELIAKVNELRSAEAKPPLGGSGEGDNNKKD